MAPPGVSPEVVASTMEAIAANGGGQSDEIMATFTRRAIETLRTGNDVALLAGDFVSPSLLSSLDFGRSMVDCMNIAGIDYVCIGNHEADISLAALAERVGEFRGVWLNSNLPDFSPSLPPFDIVDVPHPTRGVVSSTNPRRKTDTRAKAQTPKGQLNARP